MLLLKEHYSLSQGIFPVRETGLSRLVCVQLVQCVHSVALSDQTEAAFEWLFLSSQSRCDRLLLVRRAHCLSPSRCFDWLAAFLFLSSFVFPSVSSACLPYCLLTHFCVCRIAPFERGGNVLLERSSSARRWKIWLCCFWETGWIFLQNCETLMEPSWHTFWCHANGIILARTRCVMNNNFKKSQETNSYT